MRSLVTSEYLPRHEPVVVNRNPTLMLMSPSSQFRAQMLTRINSKAKEEKPKTTYCS
ncbi:hypothetical protein Hanom_Chr01g00073421 [Helianthus anomalus]